mgnify:CR=1 FL=1
MVCALVTTFIWGTAFIAQDTGMDNIGPLTFNSARFIVGFFTILPLALLFERKKIKLEILINFSLDNLSLDRFIIIGLSPFLVLIVTPLEIEESFTVLEPSFRKNFSLRLAFEPLIP